MLSAVVPNSGASGPFAGAIEAVIKSYLPDLASILAGFSSSTATYLAFPGETNRVTVSNSSLDVFLMFNENNNDLPVIVMPPGVNADFLKGIDLGFSFFGELTIPVTKLIELPDADAIVPNSGSLLDLIPDLTSGLLSNFQTMYNFFPSLPFPGLDLDGNTFIWPFGAILDGITGTITGPLFDLTSFLPTFAGNALPVPFVDLLTQFIGFINGTFATTGVYVSTLDGSDEIDLRSLRTKAQVDAGDGNDWIFDGKGGTFADPNVLNGQAGNDVFVLNPLKLASGNALTVIDGGSGTDTLRIEGTPQNDLFILGRTADGKLSVYVNGNEQVLDLTGIERLDVLGGAGDDVLVIDCTFGLLQFVQGVNFNGGEGTDALLLTGGAPLDENVLTFEGVAAGAGSNFSRRALDVQLVNFEGLDPVLAAFSDSRPGPMTIVATGDDNAVTVTASELPRDLIDGGGVLRVEIDSFMTVELINKSSLLLRTGGGNDEITIEADGVAAALSSGLITVEGGPGASDRVVVVGTAGDDSVTYTPTGAASGELVFAGPLTVSMSGVESAMVDAAGQEMGDSLTVVTNNAVIIPGAFPGEGRAIGTDLLARPLLPLDFRGFENQTTVTGNIAVIDASSGNDYVTIANGVVTVTNLLGGQNVTDVSGFNALIVNLLGGGDTVHIGGGNNFVNGILIDGGDPSVDGDAVVVEAGVLTVKIDFANQRIDGLVGGALQMRRVEQLTVLGQDGRADRFEVLGYGLPTDLAKMVLNGSDGNGDDGDTLDIVLTEGPDQITVTPTGIASAVVRGSGPQIEVAGFNNVSGSLSISGAGGIDALFVEGSSGDDSFLVSRGGAGTLVVPIAAGMFWVPVDFDDVEGLTIRGLAGQDRLTVDSAEGLVDLPNGILFDGGTGNDELWLSGFVPVVSTYNVGVQPGSGSIVHVLGEATQAVYFINVEPVVDLVPGELVINATSGSNVINYDVGPNSAPYEDLYGDDDNNRPVGGIQTAVVTIDNFESIEFGRKSFLTINGLAGNDIIDLHNMINPAGLEQITLSGGPGDDRLIGSAGRDILIGGTGSDYLEGGDGEDLAIFEGTSRADHVRITASTVSINLATDTIANIETLWLDTLGGNDVVDVYAEAGFPAVVEIKTGAGDDTLNVLLANPAPATIILADGGDGYDTAIVKGQTGDDQFLFVEGTLNIFGQAEVFLSNFESIAVLEGRRIDANTRTVEHNRFDFVDTDGNRTFVSMVGPGAVDVFRNIVNGREADIYSLELIGTSESVTRLTVGVAAKRGTDNETSIGEITGGGAWSIYAPRSDLTGRGVELTGALGILTVNDIASGGAIKTGGQSNQKFRLKAAHVGQVDLTTSCRLTRLDAFSWAGGTLQASVFERLVISGGDFGADIVNTRQNIYDFGLYSLYVRGNLNTNITADRIGYVTVVNGNASVNATVTSSQVMLRNRIAFVSLSVTGGDLLAANVNLQPGATLGTLSVRSSRGVGGNVVGSVNVTGNLNRAYVSRDAVISTWNVGQAMRSMFVGGTVSSGLAGPAAVRTGGDMGSITVGAIDSVDFLAGVKLTAGRHANTASDFTAPTTIGTIRVTGYRVPAGTVPPRFVSNSNFSAASMGTLRLINVEFADSALYVASGPKPVASIVYRDTVDSTRNFVFPPPPGQVGAPDGFINVL